MNILILGPERPALMSFLASLGDTVKVTDEKITVASELIQWADFLISYGYRHIIKSDVLAGFPHQAVNLHISYLPFNRGADPNLWSFLEDSPKGVTVHYLDPGLDTGDILARKEVDYRPDDTLRTSYERLNDAIESLFRQVWPEIRSGRQPAMPQPPGGTTHRLRDREEFEPLLTRGWDTPVSSLIGKALVAKPGKQT